MDKHQPLNGLAALFRRWPALLGFSVQDARETTSDREWVQLEHGLVLADVGLDDWMIDERAEARALLRGRTFARTLH